MKDYVGIGHAKVSVPDQVYSVLSKMDRKDGIISRSDLEVLVDSRSIKTALINSQNIDGKHIDIYGLSIGDSENFEIVKVY